MKIRLYILGFSLLVLWGCKPGTTSSQQADKEGFIFAFLTDIHLQPELQAVEGFRKAIDTINALHPDFVLTGGDLVMDALNVTYGRADSLYDLYEKISSEFEMPVHNTVGNHEVYGWHWEEDGIESNPEFGKAMYEKRMGERYYSFDHKGWHFMVLDGIYRGEGGHYIGLIDEEQRKWIRRDLEKTGKETPIVVSIHIPFITSQTQILRGSMEANSRGLVVENARDVLLDFYPYNLKLVLQGHLHYLEEINVNNQVSFITGGAVCGKWWNTKLGDPMEEGFVMIRIKGDDFHWEYVDYGWIPPGQSLTGTE